MIRVNIVQSEIELCSLKSQNSTTSKMHRRQKLDILDYERVNDNRWSNYLLRFVHKRKIFMISRYLTIFSDRETDLIISD